VLAARVASFFDAPWFARSLHPQHQGDPPPCCCRVELGNRRVLELLSHRGLIGFAGDAIPSVLRRRSLAVRIRRPRPGRESDDGFGPAPLDGGMKEGGAVRAPRGASSACDVMNCEPQPRPSSRSARRVQPSSNGVFGVNCPLRWSRSTQR
jgi:hypothetical protein